MSKKFFYCHHCFERKLIQYASQELKGKQLCNMCYLNGYRLKIGVIVEKIKNTEKKDE